MFPGLLGGSSRAMDENQAKKPMTKTEIVAALSEATGLDKHQVSGLFGELATLIGKNLGEDGPGVFTIPDLLQIKVVRKPAVEEHKAVNPFTKEEMAHDWLPDAVAAPQAVPSHSSISGSSRHSPTSSSASTQRMVLSTHLYITCNIDRQFPTFCVARVTAGPTPASASTTASICPLATRTVCSDWPSTSCVVRSAWPAWSA